MFLTQDEVQKLTGRVRYRAQLRWLAQQGFCAIPDADGKPLVLRAAVEDKMGLPPVVAANRKPGPNWEALNGTKTPTH